MNSLHFFQADLITAYKYLICKSQTLNLILMQLTSIIVLQSWLFPGKWFARKINQMHTATILHDSEPTLQHKPIVCHLSLSFFRLVLFSVHSMTANLYSACNWGMKCITSVLTDQNSASSDRFLRCLACCSILPHLFVEALLAPLG